MSPSTSRLIARGYHARSVHSSSLSFAESVLDGSINQGETELNLDSLPVLPEKEKRGRTIKRQFDRSRVIENEDEKEFELEDLPVKSQRKVIESSDEEREEEKKKRGMEIESNDTKEKKESDVNQSGKTDNSNDSSPAFIEANGLIVDSKSEIERKEFIQSNLKRLIHRMSPESVTELMETFLY